ncbi:hypothetical protein [Sulfurirhabdus autotrophica]|uniref:Periplasmic binding family protein n=1 Tax=Sulfurirhabdus autotrophica TaxID=1706046 RepID=A0A4R3YBU6_9PROT|nr:hypothetical protein [Sulfurirhabdus autotrophica]TCV89527.1 hypothetical protein EDC63_10244 [Sulfurirhabdus autotrophica]
MKLNKIAAACGLAVATLATQAFAHGPAVTPDLQVFISGSSALQGTLGKIAEGMMTAGTIDVYYDNATGGKDYRAYFGTVSGTGTALDGKKVLMHNRAAGGSFQGVGPVARAQLIDRMKIEAATCASTGAAYPSATFKCTSTVKAVPDAGVSDVEPALFVYPNLPAGETALSTTELGHISPASQNAVVFGIAVSDNVSVTNLSRSQITSLLTGNYADWSLVDPALSGPVMVERRGAGSGTQASANAYFGGLPCSANGVPLAAGSVAATPTTLITGYTVVENSSTGGVKAGLNTSFTVGNKAIGLVSTENTPVAGTDHWHFVSIDGIPATVANAVAGKYDYFVEQSIQWRNATVAGVAAPSGNMATFLDQFKTRSGEPTILATLPGVAALPTNYDPSLYPVGQVMKGTKLNNTCQPTQLFY